ncbi:MAG: competence/damage-inducible protein A [Ignavibacteria bacterium]|nr:competence/damage-inducible protein A [Ignavibacteria bacterium]
MNSVIITIGDELLMGQVVNTNASLIAGKLNSIGIEVTRIVTVSDDESQILKSLEEEYPRFDVVIVTGGLGPTHDDITRSAICKFFHTDLISDNEARNNIEAFMKARNHPWSEAAENQTLIPRGATVISNRHGTAPGELFERDNKFVVVMPGVPYEMEAMVNEFVVPFFQQKATGKIILHKTLMTTGISESVLATRLGNLDELLEGEKLAFLPAPTGVRMRITVVGSDRVRCEQKLLRIESRIRAEAEKFIYGVNDEELEEVLGRLLAERKLRIAIAESCTGGMIAHKITNVPGSSHYLDRALVTYSNQSKIDLLGVPRELIEKHGAVSREVAEAMALCIRLQANVDIGMSTTGIAGPSGGSTEKPIGLVWIGYSDSRQAIALKFQFGNDRLRTKERASQAAMELVRRMILKIE